MISCEVSEQLTSVFLFAAQIVQTLVFFKSEFQASSLLQWMYKPVCVAPVRKLKLLVFSCEGSFPLLRISILSRFKQIVEKSFECLVKDDVLDLSRIFFQYGLSLKKNDAACVFVSLIFMIEK